MTAPIPARPATTVTIESAGLAGSPLIATPEQLAAQEAAEAERLARANAHIDATLEAVWATRDQAEDDRLADQLDRMEAARARRDARRKQAAS